MEKKNNNYRKFKNRKNIYFTTALFGISAILGMHELNNIKEKRIYTCDYSAEPLTPIDKYVWKDIIPTKTETMLYTFLPSDIIECKAFIGSNEMTHYRIEINDDRHKIVEYSDWKEIPVDGLITINRNDFNNKYGKNYNICYGKYDKDLCDFEVEKFNNPLTFYYEIKEELDYFNDVRNIMVENFKKKIEKDDTDFDKVKKAYDFVIKNIQYNHNVSISDFTSITDYFNSKGIFYTDCTGYTDIINNLLSSVGVESFSVMDYSIGHIWNIVKVDNKYYHLDSTYSDTGSFIGTSQYRYFLVSDDYMRSEGRWFIKEKDVKCNEDYNLSSILSLKDKKYRKLLKNN